MQYHELLRYVFRRFSVTRGLHTALPTLKYYATRPALPPSDKPALFTMNILPPMMRVWHHFARKSLGNDVDIVIFDCSGALDPRDYPGTWVQPFLNFYASKKSDEFLYRIARNRRIGWICDDDVFIIGHEAAAILRREFAVPNTASVSFRARPWWRFEIDGKTYSPSGTYSLAINRDIYVNQERLCLDPADGNTHPAVGENKQPGRYDTFDLANETLLKKGYRCAILSKEEEEKTIAGFSGVSNAVMLLWYFKKSSDLIEYLLSPPKRQWQGNILYQIFSGLLAIDRVQDMHEKITGKRYPLRSMPDKETLKRLRAEHEPLLERGRSFEWIDREADKLDAHL